LGGFEELKDLKDMLMAVKSHSLTLLNNNYIYSMGGEIEDQKLTNICSKYEISKDNWVNVPLLNERKSAVSSCCFLGRYIFIFGGRAEGVPINFITTIEYIDSSNEEKGWEISESQLPYGTCGLGCLQISHNQIMVFGSFNTLVGISEWYVFNVFNQGCEVFAMHSDVNGFVGLTGFKNKKLFAIDNFNAVIAYDFQTRSWSDIY
jgi:N-acetylneuraminic acid mutarotase